MKIDIHTHNRLLDADAVVEAASRHRINNIVFLGDVLRYGYYPNEEQVHEINEATIECVRKHSGLCYGFCFLNPANNLDFSLREIERCVKEHGFKGVKLEVSVNCRDERLHPIMRKLEELEIPLLHHCWYKTVGKCAEESDPSDIAYLARKFPSVKIIMAHLAGCGHRGVEDVAGCSNVYIDTSGGQSVAGQVEYAVKKLGTSRILYGSDAPYRDFSCQLGRIYGADLSEETKEKILYHNAKELLKL